MNLQEQIRAVVEAAQADASWRGIVVSTGAGVATVKRYAVGASETYPVTTGCPALAAGNEVLVLRVGAGYIVVDRIR